MAKKTIDWDKIHHIIESIPKGYWMSYGDVCEAAGMKRSSAFALGVRLARATYVPATIYRVLRADGSIPAGWKGEIGTADDCVAKLQEEGITFSRSGMANSQRRYRRQP